MKTTEERLTRVELALERFIDNVSQSFDRLSMEMQDFKDEMRGNAIQRDREMKEFKDEMRANAIQRDREMKEFKDEMQSFKKDLNQKWGDMARKMGTIIEDVIYPGIKPLIKQYFKVEDIESAIRISKTKGALRDEFDIVVLTKKYIFLVEVKSSPNHNHVLDMEDKIHRYRQLFPEHNDKEMIPLLGSVVIPESVVNLCTKKGYYAIAYKEWEYLDILNARQLPFPPQVQSTQDSL